MGLPRKSLLDGPHSWSLNPGKIDPDPSGLSVYRFIGLSVYRCFRRTSCFLFGGGQVEVGPRHSEVNNCDDLGPVEHALAGHHRAQEPAAGRHAKRHRTPRDRVPVEGDHGPRVKSGRAGR